MRRWINIYVIIIILFHIFIFSVHWRIIQLEFNKDPPQPYWVLSIFVDQFPAALNRLTFH